MLLIYNKSTEPYFNLALEEYALTQMTDDILLLWRNDKAVVVGKNQIAAREVDKEYLDRNNVKLVRRLSGGGAVYHDLGNINYTMIHNKTDGDFGDYKRFTKPVCYFLSTLGVNAVYEGRNDILLNGMKISGNAQASKNKRFMHHGTLLFNVDFDALSAALRPPDAKFDSKAIQSVRSRVTNICEYTADHMTSEEFLIALYDFFAKHMDSVSRYELSTADIAAVDMLARDKYSTWAWNYGTTPKYGFFRTKRFNCGIVELSLDVKDGSINNAVISGDFFGVRDITELEGLLTGLRHDKASILSALSDIDIGEFISGLMIDEFVEMM